MGLLGGADASPPILSVVWACKSRRRWDESRLGAGDIGLKSEQPTSRVSLLREWICWVLLVLKISANAIMEVLEHC